MTDCSTICEAAALVCEKRLNGLDSLRRFWFKTATIMLYLIGFAFILSIWFMMRMFAASQKQRLNQSGRYEEHIRERREARRRKRSRAREERNKDF